jgi:hypothetical protein
MLFSINSRLKPKYGSDSYFPVIIACSIQESIFVSIRLYLDLNQLKQLIA